MMKFVSTVLCLILVQASGGAISQTLTPAERDAINNQIIAATERTFDLLKKQFHDAMPASEQTILDAITIKPDWNDNVISNVYARFDHGTRTVSVSRKFVAA